MQIEHFINQIDLTLDPPAEEPLRQYYFIAKARTLVAQMEKEAGRKMTFCVNTFGCQMNARDSEKLCGILNAIGYQESESEDADFVIYNTCTVRENANNKVYGRLGYLHGYKKKKSTHDDRIVWLYDAGGESCCKNQTELSFRRFDLWYTQYFQVCGIAGTVH